MFFDKSDRPSLDSLYSQDLKNFISLPFMTSTSNLRGVFLS
jgi:hypothetical protein